MLCDWKKLADECVAYSKSKGFEPSVWDTAPIRVACILREVEELTEALEAWGGQRQKVGMRHVKTVGEPRWNVHEELADVAIYSLLLLAYLETDNWNLRRTLNEPIRMFESADRMVRPLRRYATKAHEYWRTGHRRDFFTSLEFVVLFANELALTVVGQRIDDLARVRLAEMADRPARHGAKDPRS